jgi:hypothetical protein
MLDLLPFGPDAPRIEIWAWVVFVTAFCLAGAIYLVTELGGIW